MRPNCAQDLVRDERCRRCAMVGRGVAAAKRTLPPGVERPVACRVGTRLGPATTTNDTFYLPTHCCLRRRHATHFSRRKLTLYVNPNSNFE